MPLRMVLSLCVSLCACGPSLVEGSLGELLKMQYTSVQVSSIPAHVASPNEVAVAFQNPQGSGTAGVNTVFQVSVSLNGLVFTPHDFIDLAEKTPAGVQRGKVSRTVFGESPVTFPQLTRGQLTLNQAPLVQGATISGNFFLTFVDGIDYADGRTAFATFQGTIQ